MSVLSNTAEGMIVFLTMLQDIRDVQLCELEAMCSRNSVQCLVTWRADLPSIESRSALEARQYTAPMAWYGDEPMFMIERTGNLEQIGCTEMSPRADNLLSAHDCYLAFSAEIRPS
jgi:hypothetical protein